MMQSEALAHAEERQAKMSTERSREIQSTRRNLTDSMPRQSGQYAAYFRGISVLREGVTSMLRRHR